MFEILETTLVPVETMTPTIDAVTPTGRGVAFGELAFTESEVGNGEIMFLEPGEIEAIESNNTGGSSSYDPGFGWTVTAPGNGGSDFSGGWGAIGGHSDPRGSSSEPPVRPPDPIEFPECVEAAPAGVDPASVLDVARHAANEIRLRNDESIEYGAFLYEMNGQISHSQIFTDGLPDRVQFKTEYIPNGARVIGIIHNHPDISGINDRIPSSEDWRDVYDGLLNANIGRGVNVDDNMLNIIFTNEDGNVRIYDNTDINTQLASCAV